MSEPKRHHYVPQFYLRRFCGGSGRLWVWDRDADRVFRAAPKAVAVEKDFYYLDLYADENPWVMEKQFAYLEYDVARITDQWVDIVRAEDRMTRLPVPTQNRKLVSQFVALQFIRTADFKDILSARTAERMEEELNDLNKRILHTHALWDEDLVREFTEYIQSAIWVFGKNDTGTPFITSDNPVAFRTPDNSMWLKAGLFGTKTYVVYPLAPDIVMYCFPRVEPWLKTEILDNCISPVQFDEKMVVSENSGQVFMASRFVFSNRDDFAEERAFAKTIGTDEYAPYGEQEN